MIAIKLPIANELNKINASIIILFLRRIAPLFGCFLLNQLILPTGQARLQTTLFIAFLRKQLNLFCSIAIMQYYIWIMC